MKIEKLGIATVLMIIPSAFWLICGIGWIILPEIFLSVSYNSFVGSSWESFKTSNETISLLFEYHGRLLGIQFFILSMGLIVITVTAYKRGEKWAWVLLAVSSTLMWLTAALIDAIIGAFHLIILEIVPLFIAYCSLLISKPLVFPNANTKKQETWEIGRSQ